MQQEPEPVEPPPSSAPTAPANGNKKHATKEFAGLELILEGHIRSIDKVKQVFEVVDGVRRFIGFETTFTFQVEKGKSEKKLSYPIFIYQDATYSGKIKIFKSSDGRYVIYDEGLKRIYE